MKINNAGKMTVIDTNTVNVTNMVVDAFEAPYVDKQGASHPNCVCFKGRSINGKAMFKTFPAALLWMFDKNGEAELILGTTQLHIVEEDGKFTTCELINS